MRVGAYRDFCTGSVGCDVDVYRLGLCVLVVLQNPNDPIEAVARKVRREILAPEGLEGLEGYWVVWSRADGVARTVVFRDPERLEGPTWQYLPAKEFEKILSAFEAPDPLEGWIREGALDLEGWAESSGEHRRRSN